jgi:hypothetical protein
VYGDVVTASEKVATLEHLESTSTDITNKLLDNGAIQIAQNIADKVERIRTVQVKTLPTVEFTIKSNIEDATVELDGAVIGSAPGRFNAAPGLHQMRIGKEFFASWEKTVNIYPNQLLTVTLEMSDEGLRRYKNIETYKAEMANTKQEMELAKKTTDQELDLTKKEREAAVEMSREANSAEVYRVKSDAEIAKEQSVADAEVKRQQSAADADAKRNISEGEKKKREQSYIHDDGLGNEIKQIIHGGN